VIIFDKVLKPRTWSNFHDRSSMWLWSRHWRFNLSMWLWNARSLYL